MSGISFVTRALIVVASVLVSGMAVASAEMLRSPAHISDAIRLSSFGGRAALSPDGKRIAFVGKTYGDAYELIVATGQVRNLTNGFPHQGITRIQYLPTGDFLVTAPHVNIGANSRAHLEMWFLDKSLAHGMQPLGEQVFEGIAVSRRTNLIAWTVIDPALTAKEPWQMAFVRPTKRYIAEVEYRGGTAQIVRKREIMATLPPQCGFIEPQDFRDEDRELVYSCMAPIKDGPLNISVMGTKLTTGQSIVYRKQPGEYNEVEGVAPDGSWAAVECGKQDTPGLPPVDICRLDLEPNGEMHRLIVGTSAGATTDISNPIVGPGGKWIVFQRSDSAGGDIGEGYGLYMLRLEGNPPH